ncbi:MAG: hypothetical protein U0Y10_04330 [Spirosomataceae bacterium]
MNRHYTKTDLADMLLTAAETIELYSEQNRELRKQLDTLQNNTDALMLLKKELQVLRSKHERLKKRNREKRNKKAAQL